MLQYYNSSNLDSEQKDLAISQLKTEVIEIKQKELKYNDEIQQLTKLEHLFYSLQEEKVYIYIIKHIYSIILYQIRFESENRGKIEYTIHSIANLKTDIDTFKHNISQANVEAQKLKSESLAIKDISENKALGVTDLKRELNTAIDINENIRDDMRILNGQVIHLL